MAISAYWFLVNSDFSYDSAHWLSHNDPPVIVLFPRPTCKKKEKQKKPNKPRISGCASGKQVLWLIRRNTQNVPFLPQDSPTEPVWRIALRQWGIKDLS